MSRSAFTPSHSPIIGAFKLKILEAAAERLSPANFIHFKSETD